MCFDNLWCYIDPVDAYRSESSPVPPTGSVSQIYLNDFVCIFCAWVIPKERVKIRDGTFRAG